MAFVCGCVAFVAFGFYVAFGLCGFCGCWLLCGFLMTLLVKISHFDPLQSLLLIIDISMPDYLDIEISTVFW